MRNNNIINPIIPNHIPNLCNDILPELFFHKDTVTEVANISHAIRIISNSIIINMSIKKNNALFIYYIYIDILHSIRFIKV
jgi:hypothetical protein